MYNGVFWKMTPNLLQSPVLTKFTRPAGSARLNLVECMVRHPTAREKLVDEGKSASMYPSIRAKMVSRTKLSCPLLRQRSETGFRDRSPSGSYVESSSVECSPPTINTAMTATMILLFGHPTFVGCEGAYSACRSGFR
jgi:hypothetical protein